MSILMDRQKIACYLIFLLGFFSNIAVVSIAGNTLYTYFSIVLCIYLLVTRCTLRIEIDCTFLFLVSCVVAFVLSIFSYDFSMQWKKAAFTGTINIVLCFFIYWLVKDNKKIISSYLKGLYFSAVFQMIWMFGQFILFRKAGLDLNEKIFGVVTQYRNGSIVLTGLTYNAGMMVALLIFGFVFSKNYFMKLLFIGAALLSGSGTAMIGMVATVGIFSLIKVVRFLNARQLLNKQIVILICIFLLALVAVVFLIRKPEKMKSIISVFTRITNMLFFGIASNGSDSTHFSYYETLPYILQKTNLINILFGFGASTSGWQMSHYFSQNVELSSWVLESDVVNMIYSYGVVGTITFYFIIIKSCICECTKNFEYVVFLLGIIISGIFYNIQISWLILLELFIYRMVKTDNRNTLKCEGRT